MLSIGVASLPAAALNKVEDAAPAELLRRSRFHDRFQNAHRIVRSVRLALLEILRPLPHRIRYVRDTQNIGSARFCECIERRRFHFHREDSALTRGLDRFSRFTEWSVGGPTRADDRAQASSFDGDSTRSGYALATSGSAQIQPLVHIPNATNGG
jgi:hypothetical protein